MQFDLGDLTPDNTCFNTFFSVSRSLRPTLRNLPASINEPPREQIQDVSMSLASASDISIDSSVVAVVEAVGILTFRNKNIVSTAPSDSSRLFEGSAACTQ